jgi:dihydrofolate synthase/folylpolyglutamate synthase
MLSSLPRNAAYYFCKANIPRGMDAMELSKIAQEFSLQGKAFSSVKDALFSARKSAGVSDLVMVGGSAFVVAEVV